MHHSITLRNTASLACYKKKKSVFIFLYRRRWKRRRGGIQHLGALTNIDLNTIGACEREKLKKWPFCSQLRYSEVVLDRIPDIDSPASSQDILDHVTAKSSQLRARRKSQPTFKPDLRLPSFSNWNRQNGSKERCVLYNRLRIF